MTLSESRLNELIVVSPHRDDAAFSCGVLMHAALATMAVRILNIFTHSVYAPFANVVEQHGIEAVTELRQHEDAAAIRYLRARSVHAAQLEEINLGMLDAPLRLHVKTESVQGDSIDADDYENEVQTLDSVLRPLLQDVACVLLPLGLGIHALDGHIDHRIVRDAGRRCVSPDCIGFYEDLPYAARINDGDRESAISTFSSTLDDVQPLLIQRPNAGILKAEVSRCYTSQIDAATIEEIARYTEQRGGEQVYVAAGARRVLMELAIV